MDLNISLSEGRLFSDLYIKSTDCHQYFHYLSSHPEHTKRSIIYSQTLRIINICSLQKDFKKHTSMLRHWFLKRGYPAKIVNAEMKKVKLSKSMHKNIKKETGVPFVVTYHPSLKSLNKIINDNIYLLYMNNEAKKVFTPRPMISF